MPGQKKCLEILLSIYDPSFLLVILVLRSCVDLAQPSILVAEESHRSSFCEKLLEASTMSNRANP